MRRILLELAVAIGFLVLTTSNVIAQSQEIRIATVTRPPFSMIENGKDAGFSIDLLRAISQDLGRSVSVERMESFPEMLLAVQDGRVDGAIANISITSTREQVMDFTQPIFASGLQIMLPNDSSSGALTSAILTREIGLALLLAIGLLFGGGMLMWIFERKSQEYFDRPLKEAMFPSFWWALNLVVNGGFEERMPRSPFGRLFGVILVVSSLFIVSIFVAKITAALTIDAIQSNVQSINDLDGRRIGTLQGATAATFLSDRELAHETYIGLQELFTAFENKELDAVVFDGPILAYYVANDGKGVGKLLDKIFRPENYGMALGSNSSLREEINRSVLRLRENGTYNTLVTKWFGESYSR